MPFKWKIDIISELKNKGYNTNRIRKDRIMGESMLQKLRSGQMVSWATLETICNLLGVQPGDLIEYVSDDPAGITEEDRQIKRRVKDRAMILEATMNGSAVEVKTKSKKNHPFSLENIHKD